MQTLGQGLAKGWFPKGWFWQMFPRPPKLERGYKKRNDGPQNQNEGTKNGTQYKRLARGYTGQTHSGCRKRSAAKGVRSLFFVFGTLSVTFRSLFLTLLSLFSSLFCQTPFAGLLLRQGDPRFYKTTLLLPLGWSFEISEIARFGQLLAASWI